MLQEYALALARNSSGRELRMSTIESFYYRLKYEKITRVASPITREARESFMRAFGVAPHTQILMEQRLREWRFPLGGEINLGKRWDNHDGDQYPCPPDLYPLMGCHSLITPENLAS